MIYLYSKDGQAVSFDSLQAVIESGEKFIALQFPGYTELDLKNIQSRFGVDMSFLERSGDIEISSHFQENSNHVALQFSLPYVEDNEMREGDLFLVLTEELLFSFTWPQFDRQFGDFRFLKPKTGTAPYRHTDILLFVIEEVSDYFADIIETISKHIKQATASFLQRRRFEEQDLNLVTELNLHNIQIKETLIEYKRILILLRNSGFVTDTRIKSKISNELADIEVIEEYIQYNIDRLDDLRENITNKINLEQNQIFKLLTIITVCIAIPTWIAGIYGMNFRTMPELQWKWSYPLCLLAMLLSIVAAIIYFKRKKWY